jgi:hypothetical protein
MGREVGLSVSFEVGRPQRDPAVHGLFEDAGRDLLPVAVDLARLRDV